MCWEYGWQSPMRQVKEHMYFAGLTGNAASAKAVPKSESDSLFCKLLPGVLSGSSPTPCSSSWANIWC